jgi:hypothetical protein
MAEDKPVDGTQEKQTATQESVKPKAVEKDFSFDGDAMDKFVEQITLDEKSKTIDSDIICLFL